MTAARPETAAFPPVILDGEPSLDRPHHAILHPPRPVSQPLLPTNAAPTLPHSSAWANAGWFITACNK